MSALFDLFRQHRWLTAIALAAYAVAVTLPHQTVQDWLAIHLVQPWGRLTFYRVMAGLGAFGLLTVGAIAARRLPAHPARRELTVYSVLTLALVLLAWRFLSVNNSELVHFPQYALLGFVLMGLTLSVSESLSWVLLAGGVDEAYQYAVLKPGWGIPYDFNDVTLDFLGGALGVLLCLLWLQARPRRRPWGWTPGVTLLGAAVLGGVLALVFDRALLYEDKQRSDYWFALSRLPLPDFWFFDATWGPRTIHTLKPWEGPLLLLTLLGVYSRLDAKFEFQVRR